MGFFERIEAFLESTGSFGVLLYLRLFETMFMTRKSDEEQMDWVQRKCALDRKGLEITQRETYLKEEIVAWRSDAQVSSAAAGSTC